MNHGHAAKPEPTRGWQLDRHSLYRRIYPLRALGMALGVLPVGIVLLELGSTPLIWIWVLGCGVLWPHVAYWQARRSDDPWRAERHNLIIDSLITGSLLPLMHFNLLPSVILVTVNTADKLASGMHGLWWRSLIALALALLAGTSIYGLHLAIPTSTAVVVACLPLLVIHTLAGSATSHYWIQKVQRANAKLAELQRMDALTGLESRRHWESMANALIEKTNFDHPATLVMLDVDHFKQANDRYGHACGDDVLRAVAQCIVADLPAGSHAGRLGGDEFVVCIPGGTDAAFQYAERIRTQVAAMTLPCAPEARFSISLGLAPLATQSVSLRLWLEAADKALYRAKAAGRNQLHQTNE